MGLNADQIISGEIPLHPSPFQAGYAEVEAMAEVAVDFPEVAVDLVTEAVGAEAPTAPTEGFPLQYHPLPAVTHA